MEGGGSLRLSPLISPPGKGGEEMTKQEQEQAFRELCGKSPEWKKEALLLELFWRAREEDKRYAIEYLEGKRGLFGG